MIRHPLLTVGAVLLSLACGGGGGSDPTPNEVTPVVASIAPQDGTPGTTVTISGSGFSTTAAENQVAFGDALAQVTSATATELTVIAPAGSGAALVSVAVNGETATSHPTFTYQTHLCPEYAVSYTLGAESYALTHGLTEAGGIPHGNPNAYESGAPEIVASQNPCGLYDLWYYVGLGEACGETLYIYPDLAGGERIARFYWEGNEPFYWFAEEPSVQVTVMDDEAIKGTFTGEGITGEFCVARNDEFQVD
jgi:hypothetical protein